MRTLLLAALFTLFATSAYGADFIFEFDHSPVKEVVSYNVYVEAELWGSADVADVQPVTGYFIMSVTKALDYDTLLSFQMTAVFADGTEGLMSNAISGTVPRPVEPEVPPVLNRIIIRDGDVETILDSG